MAAPNLRSVPQLAIDEKVVTDPELEAVLEKRLRAQDDLAEVKTVFKGIDTEARGAIAKLELGDDAAVRVGRFRITRKTIPARTVSFDTAPSSRLKISLAETA